MKLFNFFFFNFFINFTLFTVIVKFNFINSVHNFTSFNFSFQFFFEFSYLFCVLFLYIFLVKLFKKKNFFLKKRLNILSNTLFLINILVYTYIFIDFFFIFFNAYAPIDLVFKNYKLVVFIISNFFLINFNNKFFINFLLLTFWELSLNYFIKYKTLSLDSTHTIFLLFIIFNNYIFFFFDLIFISTNNNNQFFIVNSNTLNNCLLKCFIQSTYSYNLIFNNSLIFFKSIFFNNLLFTEILISSEKLLLNLNFIHLIKLVSIALIVICVNTKIKILFIF